MSGTSDTDTKLSQLREENVKQRKVLRSNIAILTMTLALALVALFLIFFLLGPQGSLETYITVIGELTAICLFAIGLATLIK